jgi:GNAT superfamily N-acetyltransferase
MILKSYWNKFYRTTEKVTIPDTSLDIREIGIDHAKDYAKVVTTVFGIPPAMKEIFESAVGKNSWYHYMAFDKNKPVAAGSMYVYGDTAWFGMATTLPEYRGKGAQGAIISARINKAQDLGCKWISVETAEHSEEKPNPSYMNMLKYRFDFIYQRPNFVYEPAKIDQ